jgi:hypothetical protein
MLILVLELSASIAFLPSEMGNENTQILISRMRKNTAIRPVYSSSPIPLRDPHFSSGENGSIYTLLRVEQVYHNPSFADLLELMTEQMMRARMAV